MTGLLAIVSLDGQEVPAHLARAQLAAVVHRGDGDPVLRHGPGIVLGTAHRPTTPEAEHESLPVVDPNRPVWLAWDGRLDNRAELAVALSIEPTTASTLTDADYILRAYHHWGDDLVAHLLGDWAIVIWDDAERRLFCAKDPLGWRQLFFSERDGLLCVGSEPQQLLHGFNEPPVIDHDYLLRHLGGALPAPGQTWYRDVRELEGGETLVTSSRGAIVSRYWSEPTVRRRQYRDPRDYVDEFSEIFGASIDARARSNGPIASYLSGGLDSSYVTMTAATRGHTLTAITGYSAGTTGVDERKYARAVVEAAGVDHIEVDISDCWALSSDILTDDVFDCPSLPPQGPHLMRFAETAHQLGATVVLGGEGGDDWLDADRGFVADALLQGHPRTAVHLARLRARRRWPLVLLRSLYAKLAPVTLRHGVSRLAREDLPAFDPIVDAQPGWEHPATIDQTSIWSRSRYQALRHHAHRQRSRAIVGWIDRQVLAPQHIELRSPFHDLRVIELMAATPDWVKHQRGRFRDIVRLAKPALPELVAGRGDKGYFNELVIPGLANHERERVVDAGESLIGEPGIHPERIREALQRLDPQMSLTDWRAAWAIGSGGLFLQGSSKVSTPPQHAMNSVRRLPLNPGE